MKTVEEMTDHEFKAIVGEEGAKVLREMTEMAPALEKLGDTEAKLVLLSVLIAKERVWRKDLDSRLKVLEKK